MDRTITAIAVIHLSNYFIEISASRNICIPKKKYIKKLLINVNFADT